MALLKNTIIDDTGFLKIAVGNNAQRVGSNVGETRFNSETGLFEAYAASGWHTLSPYNMTITSVTNGSGVSLISGVTQINPEVSGTITIQGFNFSPNCTVTLDSTLITSGVVVTNPKLITITTGTSFNVSAGSYTNLTVTNDYGQTVTVAYPITVVGGPQFTTATNIGTFTEGTISTSVAASSPGGTVTYTANAVSGNGGSGYGLPAGLSISSSGAITGFLAVTGTTTYNLTIKATDNSSRTASKDFTLILTDQAVPVITTSAGSLGTINFAPAQVSGAAAWEGTFSSTITSSNPSSTGRLWKITSGSLPPGITLNSISGVISGTYRVGAKQPASQVFNFGVTVSDEVDNRSAEVLYSITVNTPYYYRQILTTGYLSAGYKDGTPWKNVNRLMMFNEMTVSLGDQLTYAVNYHGGSCSADKSYIYAVPATLGNTIPGNKTTIFNMRTEVGTTGSDVGYGGKIQAAVVSANDGFQTAAYITGGFTGTNSNIIEKFTYNTEAYSVVSGQTTTTTNLGEGWGATTDGYGVFQGGTGMGTASSYKQKFTISTETLGTQNVYLSASCQQKFLMSKLNRVYGGDSGTYGNVDAPNFRKTIWTTDQQFVMSKFGGASCGEEIFIMGQDIGFAVGIYAAAGQVNDAFKFNYSTDTGVAGTTGLARKGTSGSSSGNGAWRD